jgi:hypothetical protein
MIGQKHLYDKINPKTIWFNIGLVVAVLVLVLVQFSSVVFSPDNQGVKADSVINQNSNSQPINIQNRREYQKMGIKIQNIRQTRENLTIDYSLVNFDAQSGKAFIGFYFDEFVDTSKTNIYYGQSPFNLPNQYVPVGFKKVCTAIFLPNLEQLEGTETCEEFITSQ